MIYILRYGLIAGLIIGIPMLWRMLAAKPGEVPVVGMLLTYLVMLGALTAVFLGIKASRDKVLGGVIRFLPALAMFEMRTITPDAKLKEHHG